MGLTLLLPSPAAACPYSIRDSAFIGGGSSAPYRLHFLVKGDFPGRQEFGEWVETASAVWLSDSNVVCSVVDADGPQIHTLESDLPGGFRPPEGHPSAVLVSPRDTAMVLGSFKGKSVTMDTVMEAVAGVVESPARDKARRRLVESWCVVLLIEGADGAENERARKEIRRAAKRMVGSETELDKVIASEPYLLSVRATDPEERVLLWSLGLQGEGGSSSTVRAVMLTGRGELRGPVLEGVGITEEKVHGLFVMLGRSCTCTTDPVWLSGPAMPLIWDSEMEKAVEAELGFDPRDPEALRLIDQVLAVGVGFRSSAGVGLGYSEMAIEVPAEKEARAAGVDGSSLVNVADGVDDGSKQAPELATVHGWWSGPTRILTLVCGAALLFLAAGTVVILRLKAKRHSR